MSEVVLDGESLTPEDVAAVARDGASVAVADAARERVRESRGRVEHVLDGDETVYGINTGFGELVDQRIPPEDVERLQTNLVRSHAAGAGRELDREAVRAMMLTRINALVKGYSGIREVVVNHLLTMLNEGVHPVVRSRGSLGASGDLAPLAHMALVLIGEGQARVESRSTDGSSGQRPSDDGGAAARLAGDEALATADLDPLTLRAKEGLALINGTQLTVGLAALAAVDAERAVRAADAAGALTTEVTLATTAACDDAIQAVRPHRGQRVSARNVKRLTEGSEIVESHRNCDRVQDAYSIRCLPQVHGAVRDAATHLREAVETELNSATDNPLVFPPNVVDDRASGTGRAAVLSGGNFHGEPLALRLDYLTSAVTELAAISERRDMIAQYTAAALLNENRSIGRPSTDNTPVSGGQEDHVSMSGQSALDARRAVENAVRVVATELLCGAQAAEFVTPEAVREATPGVGPDEVDADGDGDLSHGTGTARAYEAVREVVTPLSGDRPVHEDVELVDAVVSSGALDLALDDFVE
ncbi:histidine ammonia-lyase [Halobacteriales archaeon QS_9_68_17]|nr:MAG: histidine ammonia-lyase [Halobacteriales archaeon QS_9_68_17]